MTVPIERTNAVNWTRQFMYELIDPKKTPRVPKAVRQRALHLLRHYPSEFDMKLIADKEDLRWQENPISYKVFGNGWG
jgi:hypothetical protein